ncbi:MAG: peptidylprolyl isomerase [Parvibaculum sp.]|nr:peptidylprolyl isomerase [Parvibaculum sp.]
MNEAEQVKAGASASPLLTFLSKAIREPLVHFLVLGGLLFAAYGIINRDAPPPASTVLIDNGVVADILQRYEAVWKRPPTPKEMRGLINSYIRDEVLYREGVAIGLDQDDPVVRRRIRQKMDVMAEEAGRADAPDDAAMQAYLDKNAARYMAPPVVSFEQVMFDPDRRGEVTQTDVTEALAALQAGADQAAYGDAGLLPREQSQANLERVARDFGEAFASALESLPIGTWQGPVLSGYGIHLVRLSARIDGRKPMLDEARQAVSRDMENDRRIATAKVYYETVLKNYEIRVEANIPAAANPQAAQ